MKTFLALTLAALVLTGCSGIRNMAGLDKNSPDEFAIVNQPPLSMPPDYTLRPPRPGEPSPQNVTSTAQAINALFPGRTTMPPPMSAGEEALLQRIGAAGASPDVRSVVDGDTTEIVRKGELLGDILGAEERTEGGDTARIERVGSESLKNN